MTLTSTTRDATVTERLKTQEQLLPFLLNPRSYPHRPKAVRLLQTHSSFVFLAPPLVFKVKKPVNFGFLDFSTLEKRRYFCEREVLLNRRLSPKIYLGVTPISVTDGRFTFGPGDEIVEYAVKMRQLSQRYFLDQQVRRGSVTRADIDRIAVRLREFYLAQHPSEEIETWGRVDRLRISTDENFRQTEPFVGPAASWSGLQGQGMGGERESSVQASPATLTRPASETIRRYTERFYRLHRALFTARVRQKWIRDCHGDLHLEHIHLTPRELHIYDCIEFNDRLRYVDVASDAAFLAMDLDYEGYPELARYFASRMAMQLSDDGMPWLMDFYKCYRAYVRGKVESLHSVAHAAPESERSASVEKARRYFRLALKYAVAGSQPLVLVVMGRIASGKSTLAAALSAELGWKVFSSDRVRKEMAGFPLYERSSLAARRRLYSAAMTRRTYEKLAQAAALETRAGRGVILDATFARQAQRAALRQDLAAGQLICRFLEAEAGDRIVKQRLRAREIRVDEISDARLEDFSSLSGLYEPPRELSPELCVQVRSDRPLEDTVTRALQALSDLQVKTAFSSP